MRWTDLISTTTRRPWVRWTGLAIGLGLLVAAIAVVVGQRDTIASALDAVRRPDPRLLAILVGGVVANLLLTAGTFHLLIGRFGRVGRTEMVAVVSVATLVNYLPLRPGLFGRIAYHKAANDIPARATLRTIVEAAALSSILAAWTAGAVALAAGTGWSLLPIVVAPIPVCAVVGLAVPRRRALVWAAGLRHGEVLVWAVRYDAAFGLLGESPGFNVALVLASLATMANLVPLVSNGLGLREWGVGLATPLLASMPRAVAFAAELVNRAVELVVVLVAGLLGLAWLAARRRAMPRKSRTES